MVKMGDEEFKKESEKFFKEENEKAVTELQEALHIDQTLKLFVKYLNNNFLDEDMSLMEALEKLEKRKFELIGIDPENAEPFDNAQGKEPENEEYE